MQSHLSLFPGFATLLSQLTDIEGLNQDDFEANFHRMQNDGNYFIVVVEDLDRKVLVATATLFVEHKFIHKNGMGRKNSSFLSLNIVSLSYFQI